MQGNMAAFKQGAYLNGKLLPAGFALEQARAGLFPLNPINPITAPAMRTYRTARPTHTLKIFYGLLLIVENFIRENGFRHGLDSLPELI
jgi:hypothetical protein